MHTEQARIRLDKWLWAARFFKTRSLATDAINGGKVHLNRQRVKPAKEVHLGDEVSVRSGYEERTVVVSALSDRRGPASEAAKLYQETPDSLAKREALASQRRAERAQQGQREPGSGRPTKQERRAIKRFIDTDNHGGGNA